MKANLIRIKNGITGVFSGIYFIHKHRLWNYVSFPVMITAVGGFFLKTALAGVITILLAKVLSTQLYDWFPTLHRIPFHIYSAVSFISSFTIYWPIYWMLSFVMTFLYNVLGNIVWSFFSGSLQEKVELIVTGKYVKIPLKTSLKWTLTGLWDVLKDIAIFGIFYGASFLFLFLPFGGIVLQGFVMVLINSYLIGRTNLRTALIPRVSTLKERNLAIRKKMIPEAIGLGLPETLSVFLPFVNVFVFFFLWAGAIVGSVRISARKMEKE